MKLFRLHVGPTCCNELRKVYEILVQAESEEKVIEIIFKRMNLYDIESEKLIKDEKESGKEFDEHDEEAKKRQL